MTHVLSGDVLPDRLHRLRTHADPTQAERRNRSFFVVIAMREDKRREVFGASISPRRAPWIGARC